MSPRSVAPRKGKSACDSARVIGRRAGVPARHVFEAAVPGEIYFCKDLRADESIQALAAT